jgi:hypothetical protein
MVCDRIKSLKYKKSKEGGQDFNSLQNSSRGRWHRKSKSQEYSQESEQGKQPTIAMEILALNAL